MDLFQKTWRNDRSTPIILLNLLKKPSIPSPSPWAFRRIFTHVATLYDGDCAAVHCQPIDPFPPPSFSLCRWHSLFCHSQVSLSHLIDSIIINTLQLFQQNISDCLTAHITLHQPRAVLRLCALMPHSASYSPWQVNILIMKEVYSLEKSFLAAWDEKPMRNIAAYSYRGGGRRRHRPHTARTPGSQAINSR